MSGISQELSVSLLFPLFLLFGFLLLFKWLNPTRKTLPPSPPKLPIIGNLHQIGSLPHRSLKTLAEKYGSMMLLHLGRKPTLVVSSPDVAEMVLKTNDLNVSSRPKSSFTGKLLYDYKSVAFAPYGEYWRQVRSICVLQLLSQKRVQSFRRVREEEIVSMLERISKSCLSSSPIDIGKLVANLNNDIISRVALGKRFSEEGSGSKFKKMFEEYLELVGVFNVGDYIPWLGWINHINGLEAKVNRVAKELDAYFETIVEEGMKRRKNFKVLGDSEREKNKSEQDFLDVLLEIQENSESGPVLHRDSIKAIILDMFVGGTDTTATLLEWVISELVKNPGSMAKLQDEVRIFANPEKSYITEDDLDKFPYLKAVIKETLRMHPPAPLLVPRETRNNIKIMGYDISVGTQVIVNVFAIGRDPSVWKNGDEFQPERFLNSLIDVKGQHFEVIPFGSGRRMCPGYRFAMVTAELTMANLMLKFNFKLANGARPEDLDMIENASIITKRKTPLVLVASVPN